MLFLQKSPQGFTALLVAVTFLSGIVLLFLGIIGEYVGRIYEETKGRPQYIVGRIVNRGRSELRDQEGDEDEINRVSEQESPRQLRDQRR